MATADLNSNITISTFISNALGPFNFQRFSNRVPDHFDNGFAIGHATSEHQSDVKNTGDFNVAGDFIGLAVTKLNLNVMADDPWGLGVAWGWAETGYNIDLANAGLVQLTINPNIHVKANTTDWGEFAWANFRYKVT